MFIISIILVALPLKRHRGFKFQAPITPQMFFVPENIPNCLQKGNNFRKKIIISWKEWYFSQISTFHNSRKEPFVSRIPVDGIRLSPRRVLALVLSVTKGKRGRLINYQQQTSCLRREAYTFSLNIIRVQSAKTKNNKWTSKTLKNMRNWQNRWQEFKIPPHFNLICHF